MWDETVTGGWIAPDKFACVDCVDSKHLKNAIRESSDTSTVCDYCSNGPAAHLSAVLQPISQTLNRYFQHPDAAGIPLDKGDWVINPMDTFDALMQLPLACNDVLFEDLANAFCNDCWVSAGGIWSGIYHRHERLANAWDHFEEMAKHRARYFLGSNIEIWEFDPGNEFLQPTALLDAVGRYVRKFNLIRTLNSKLTLYRARHSKNGAAYSSFDEMGPPPKDAAKAGRMNAAGIPYFYLARERRTAIAEVASHPPGKLVIGSFKLNRAIPVLDLTCLEEPPSLFDDDAYERRQSILFLRDFVQRIASPVRKDGREHVEFVPSQVVSEYFSEMFASPEGDGRIGGMVYPSTVIPPGQNVVLFPPRDWDKWEKIATLDSTEELEFENWQELISEIRP
ncbi:MAG: RES domain-containing protein [Gammaproteobacteria bacterium]|nr:RES domain-containing protein [Gammaproteobacteria bacterium]MDE0415047.1 RES domain-containing protein [Gammaproteobacteria bacterium]